MKYSIFILFLLIVPQVLCQTKTEYLASEENFPNPERGFYSSMSSWDGDGKLNPDRLKNVKAKQQSLILREYYIPAYANSDLDSNFFSLLDNDFNLMRKMGIKCILRFAYSNEICIPDAPLKSILRHIEQLSPYLKKYSDVIAFMQAGFIGAWGEWHSSENNLDNTESRKAILEKILSVLPADRMVQVRTPYFKRSIFNIKAPLNKSEAFSGNYYSRVGHHNDCFLADYNDVGTYSDTTEETNYLSIDSKYVPVGGETCAPGSFSECANSLYQMKRLHWTYLNNDYHRQVIKDWDFNCCLEEIQKKLGYRFVLLNGEFTDSSKPGGLISIKVKLTNIGFASLYNPRNIELVLKNDKEQYILKLKDDPRFWQSGDTVTLNVTAGLPEDITTGNFSLYMNMPDVSAFLHDNPLFSIRMANKDVWEPLTGYNNLKASVNVNNENKAESYTGEIIFEAAR
jgi:hypothetical protein